MSDYGGDDDAACAALVSELGCPALVFQKTNFHSYTASDQIMERSSIMNQMSSMRRPQNHQHQTSQMSIKPTMISKKSRAAGK
jgi:hypothetical protein